MLVSYCVICVRAWRGMDCGGDLVRVGRRLVLDMLC